MLFSDWISYVCSSDLKAPSLYPVCLQGPLCRKPIVFAAQGYCYTWGVEIMLNTDVRVVAEDTQFAMLEVKRGIYPCGGATLRLPQQMGWANAQRSQIGRASCRERVCQQV